MIRTRAVYFDGITSRPQDIEILLDTTNCILVFHDIEGSMKRWSVYEIEIHQIGNLLEIVFGENPQSLVKIDDSSFIKELKKLLKEKGRIGIVQRLLDLGPKVHISLALVILGIITLSYFFIIPKVAEKAAYLIPESYDNTMGNSFYNQYVESNEIDSSKSEALTQFANQLDLGNTKELQFTVIRSDIINAFALPDGHIIVFTGILDLMDDYNELAGLLCHEAIHINKRHSMKMLCRDLSGTIFLLVVFSDANRIMNIIGNNLHSLQTLTYSRNFEKEADLRGVELMIANGLDPKGMEQLFKRLQKDSDQLIPEFISTHPVTENRINYIDKIVKQNHYIVELNKLLPELFYKLKK